MTVARCTATEGPHAPTSLAFARGHDFLSEGAPHVVVTTRSPGAAPKHSGQGRGISLSSF